MLPQAVVYANASKNAAEDKDNETNESNQVIEAETAKGAPREGCSTDEAKSNDNYTQRRREDLGLAIMVNWQKENERAQKGWTNK